MNIESVQIKHNCTSCQVCAAVCPKDVISIKLDNEGFYRPYIDKDGCVDCSLCVKVCYKYAVIEKTQTEQLEKIEIYAAEAIDDEVIANTSSGGVADLLAKRLIENGYKCCGVAYDFQNDCAENIVAEDVKQTHTFRGSKYIQSYSFPAFKEILKDNLNEKVAVFGTPCHIFAIDKYLRLRNKRNNFVLIDFYCHGCPSIFLWSKYIKEIRQRIAKPNIDFVNFRSKIRGWGNFHVVVEGGEEIFYTSKKTNDEFYTLFFSDLLLNEACYTCECRNTLEYTDIRVGDFWGKEYDLNNRGVSVVNLLTGSGKKAFTLIEKDIKKRKHPFSDFIAYQSWDKSYSPNKELRIELLSMLSNKSIPLKEIVRYYFSSQNIQQKIKRHLKNSILLMPQEIISAIKKIYH
jgi:coenzyme F420-reducing hydrogenase beta subunit